jgi:O-antigen ligase
VFSALLLAMLLFWKQKLSSPKIALGLLGLAFIPLLQLLLGQVFFLQNAVLSSLFVLAAWFALNLGYSLSLATAPHNPPREGLMYGFALTMLIAGLLSSVVAWIQWLHLGWNTRLILNLVSDRPYANIGQPNLLATLLLISVLSLWYLFEKQKIKQGAAAFLAVLLLFTLSLTLSRTAWLASFLIIIFLLLKANTQGFVLKRRYMLLWFGIFMGCFWLLPYINHFLAEYLIESPKFQMRSMADRTGSGFERFAMWQQIFAAVLDKPWTGYGWYQTTAAQYAVAGQFPVHVWLTSAHNIVIDLLAWNGLALGAVVVLYLGYVVWLLLCRTQTMTACCSFLMILAVLLHALLEYPLYYAYYLLPIACLTGVILAQRGIAHIVLPNYVLRSSWGIGLLMLLLTAFFYSQPTPPRPLANQPQSVWQQMSSSWSLFDKLDRRTQWVQLKPTTHLTALELAQYRQVVQCYLTHYDMYKFAQVLAFNAQQQEAMQLLFKINAMYDKHYRYQDLLDSLQPNTKPAH